MGDEIGRGVIAVEVDPTKLKVGIEDAKRSIAGLGASAATATASASRSIDRYVKSLETQNATFGMSAREADKYRLTLRGATAAQLAAADAAHDHAEAQRDAARQAEEAGARSEKIAQGIQLGIAAIGAAAIAGFVAFDHLVKGAGDFSDLADKTGDSAQNIASLAVAAGTAGIEMTSVADLAVKLSKNLVGVDDDSAAAGAAIAALGLNLGELKKMAAADRLEAVAKALDGFADGAVKGDVAMALLGKSGADALGFLKELGQEGGRQVLLTNEQIAAADDYADSQAKLKTQMSLYAESVATDLLPVMTEFKNAIVDITKDQQNAATASALIEASLDGLVLVFQTLILVGSDVAFTFNAVGTEIGAVAAQAVALAHLDIKGFRSISAAVTEDAERARAQLDKFQARILAINQPKPAGEAKPASPEEPPKPKPTLKFNGAPDKNKKGEADKIAAAQLNLDIENIRKAGQEQIDAYANAERIMQAMRSAGLVDDKEYYDSKLGFLRLNNAAQEVSLQSEIARLEKEEGTGKRKLDNQKKIVEAQAKLDKMRSASVASITVLAIDEEAANRRIAQSYLDAKNAAEQYIATIKKQADREIEGMGKGDKFRQVQSSRGQISDSRDNKISQIQMDFDDEKITRAKYDIELKIANETYDKELAIYEAHLKDLDQKRSDWSIGAQDALANYLDQSKDVAGQTGYAFANAFQTAEDAFANFTMTGKLNFKSMASSIIADFARIEARKGFSSLLSMGASALGAYFGGNSSIMSRGASVGDFTLGAGTLDTSTSFLDSIGRRAKGGPVASGTPYLVGEQGPEIFKPSGAGTIIPNHVLNGMGGGAGGSVSINLVTNISGGTATTQASGGNDVQSRAAADALMAKMKQVVMQETKNGGIISNLVQGRG
jgi:lambda family phage tail tape measure protein